MEKKTYILLQREGPLPSTAGAKDPNTIWKSKPKQNLATYFTQTLESKDCSLFSTHTDGGLPF
jgi:hypothetical protein